MSVMHQNRRNNILLGQSNNALTWLVILNAIVFVAMFSIRVYYENSYPAKGPITGDGLFQTQVLNWLTLPSSFKVFATRPWTLFTYMFVHSGPWEMLSTVLWLWSFGYILQDLAGNNKLMPIYIYGGLAGGLFYMLATNIFGAMGHAAHPAAFFVTGSASIIAVAVATTFLSPQYKIFPMINGGIPLWVLTTAFAIIVFASFAISNVGFAAGHIGAALLGVLFIYQLRRGRDLGAWMANFATWVDDLFNPEKKLAKEMPKQKLFYKASKKPFVKKTVVTQQRVDDLLDKINQKGYHFLTDEEKDFLKKASEQDVY